MLQIYCDFDGTITNLDTIVFLTEHFGAGGEFRRRILEQIQSGRISVFEAIERELKSVTVSWQKARQALLENVRVDPGFPDFVRFCSERGYPLQVVSSGIRRVVGLFVKPFGVPYSGHPVQMKPEGWIYQKDEDSDKLRILQQADRRVPIAYVGDGTSDVEVIPLVDVLFATGYLAHHCAHIGREFYYFDSFREVIEKLKAEDGRRKTEG